MPQGLDDRSPGPQSTSLRIAAMQRHKDVADPAGARRMEELRGHPGNLLLVPPRGKLPGVNAGTSDFIGIYTSVAPPNGCKDGVAPGVLATPAGFRSWAKRQQCFRNPQFQRVSVRGLSGIVADLRLARGWTKTCSYSGGVPVQPMITGLGVSYLDHNVLPGQVTRPLSAGLSPRCPCHRGRGHQGRAPRARIQPVG
jgi:hypothetical protein